MIKIELLVLLKVMILEVINIKYNNSINEKY